MKSRICCAFMIAMLLVSTVVFGEIITTGDEDEEEWPLGYVIGINRWHSATAYDDSDDGYGTGLGYGEGWEFTYTTEDGWFDWSYYLYVWTDAELWLEDANPYSVAHSVAQAEVDFDYYDGNDLAYEALADIRNTDDEPRYAFDGVYTIREASDNDYWYEEYGYPHFFFYADEGIHCEHVALAVVSTSGEDNIGISHADARAWASMSPWYEP